MEPGLPSEASPRLSGAGSAPGPRALTAMAVSGAIITVIAAVLFCRALLLQMATEADECRSQLHQLGLAASCYQYDCNAYPPSIQTLFDEYVPDRTILQCPATWSSPGAADGQDYLSIDWSHQRQDALLHSYPHFYDHSYPLFYDARLIHYGNPRSTVSPAVYPGPGVFPEPDPGPWDCGIGFVTRTRGIFIVRVDGTVFWDPGARWLKQFAAAHPEVKVPLPE